jgi:hypothetical protein
MKKLFLLSALLFAPIPVMAQQVNNFAVCTQNQEVYRPGGYDRYGNYVPGGVSVQTYNVPCNGANQYYSNGGKATNPNCNPTRTVLGAVLGGAIGRAAAMNYPRNYGWATALGASLGGLTFAC